MNDFNDITYEKEVNGICTITLNRPKIKNALSQRTFFEIETVLADMESDSNAKVLIITGCKEANAFSSGGYFDLKFFKLNIVDPQRERVKFWNFSKPVIAAINGYAIGAGITMILMSADLIYMAEDAWLSFSFVKRGIMAQSAMSFLLPLYLGFQKAKEILYFGEKITAIEAAKLGLVNRVLPLEELLPYARKMAKKLIPPEGPSLSVKQMKKVIHEYFGDIVFRTQDLEKKGNTELFKSHDFREALRAFKEKREPAFKGR